MQRQHAARFRPRRHKVQQLMPRGDVVFLNQEADTQGQLLPLAAQQVQPAADAARRHRPHGGRKLLHIQQVNPCVKVVQGRAVQGTVKPVSQGKCTSFLMCTSADLPAAR